MDMAALHQMIIALKDALLEPLQGALDGVAGIGLPLLYASIPLVAGFHLLRAGAGAAMPSGAMISALLPLGAAIAALKSWPLIVDTTFEQIQLQSGLIGISTTDPVEIISSGSVLATLAVNTGGAMMGYLGITSILTGLLYFVAAAAIFAAYTVISAISLMAFVELWCGAVLLSPLIAMLPIMGFTQAGFVPLSFLMSAVMRITGIALVASFGTTLIVEYAIPAPEEEVEWIHVFAAAGLAGLMVFAAWNLNNLVSRQLVGAGAVGFAGGVSALKSTIVRTASSLGGSAMGAAGAAATGAGGVMSRNAASLGARYGGGGGGSSSSGVQGTSSYVNARRKSA